MFYFQIHYLHKLKHFTYVVKAYYKFEAIEKWLLAFNEECKFVKNINTFMSYLTYKPELFDNEDDNVYECKNYGNLNFECIKGSSINLEDIYYNSEYAAQEAFSKLRGVTRRNISMNDVEYIVGIIAQYRFSHNTKSFLESNMDEKDYTPEVVCNFINQKVLQDGKFYNFDDLKNIYEAEAEYFIKVIMGNE